MNAYNLSLGLPIRTGCALLGCPISLAVGSHAKSLYNPSTGRSLLTEQIFSGQSYEHLAKFEGDDQVVKGLLDRRRVWRTGRGHTHPIMDVESRFPLHPIGFRVWNLDLRGVVDLPALRPNLFRPVTILTSTQSASGRFAGTSASLGFRCNETIDDKAGDQEGRILHPGIILPEGRAGLCRSPLPLK